MVHVVMGCSEFHSDFFYSLCQKSDQKYQPCGSIMLLQNLGSRRDFSGNTLTSDEETKAHRREEA